MQLTVAISKESFVFYLIEKVEANSVKVFELPSLPIPIAPMKDVSSFIAITDPARWVPPPVL